MLTGQKAMLGLEGQLRLMNISVNNIERSRAIVCNLPREVKSLDTLVMALKVEWLQHDTTSKQLALQLEDPNRTTR